MGKKKMTDFDIGLNRKLKTIKNRMSQTEAKWGNRVHLHPSVLRHIVLGAAMTALADIFRPARVA